MSDTELSPSGQHNMEVQMHESLSSPPLSNMADSTFKVEPGEEENVSALHEDSVIQETWDTNDDPQQNDDQHMSSSEAATKHQLKVELHHDTKDEQTEQQIADEAKSDLHLDQDEVNLQSEDPLEISTSENEAGPSVSNREIEMTDPEDENVERPKRDPKERASTASNLRKKQNLLKTSKS